MVGRLRTELVLDALVMVVQQRHPDSVIHHSDQGCQYTSFAFDEHCRRWEASMGSIRDCFDDAMAESFFSTLECELLDRTSFQAPPVKPGTGSSPSAQSNLRVIK